MHLLGAMSSPRSVRPSLPFLSPSRTDGDNVYDLDPSRGQYGYDFTRRYRQGWKTALFPVKDEARRDTDSCPRFHSDNNADRQRRRERKSRPVPPCRRIQVLQNQMSTATIRETREKENADSQTLSLPRQPQPSDFRLHQRLDRLNTKYLGPLGSVCRSST